MPLPLLLDLCLAAVAAFVALLVAAWASASPAVPAAPALAPAREAGEAIRPHRRLRSLLTRRLDRTVATGFLLTLAVACALAAGFVLGVLAYLVRSFPALKRVDRSVAAWGYNHRTPLSRHGLDAITQLGNIEVVVVLAVVLAGFDLVRSRNRWCGPFLLVVLAGMELITTGVKDLVERTRPALVAAAAHLGPSFPERPLGDRGRVLRGGGARPRSTARPPGAPAARRRGRRARRRRRREPRAPRPPLALRRRRRAGPRLGLVRALRRRLRRPPAEADGRGRHGFGGRDAAAPDREERGAGTVRPAPARPAGSDVSYEARQPAPPGRQYAPSSPW